ncbi:CapA family protein [Candidatus Parcubacteria bacterium]|nr:MAG: CapA family protein [Candidatus Parcubacteria bacterium]
MKKRTRQYIGTSVAIAVVGFTTFPVWAQAPIGEHVRAVADAVFEQEVQILFGGDVMLDRTIRSAIQRYGENFVFSCVNDLLHEADFAVVNLEGPITGNPSMSLGSVIGSPENFTFTFPLETPNILKQANIWMVNLGNNHILNFGWDGVRETTQYLKNADVHYFGDPTDQNVAHERVRGVPIAFISYNEFAPYGWRESISKTVEQITTARRDQYVPVVYAHWGDEYEPAPERVKELARSFVDAGAEIVIGAHPHVVQEHEVYKDKYIYYSLGNFVFDQYWNEHVRRGLLLRVTFTQAGVTHLEEIPIDNQSGPRPCAV